MPYKNKQDRAAATRRWREKKRLGTPTQPKRSVIPPVEQRSDNGQRVASGQQNAKTGHPTSTFDVLREALKPVASAPAFMHPKVRSIYELPERALQELQVAGGSRQGNTFNFPPGFDGAGWKLRWGLQ